MDALESILDVAGRGSTSIQELGFRSSDGVSSHLTESSGTSQG